MKTTMRAAILFSLAMQSLGAGVSMDCSCSQPADLLSIPTVSISPATVGTGLQPVVATITGVLSQLVVNSTIQILATCGGVPVLSLQQNLCGAMQGASTSNGVLGPVIQLASPLLVAPFAGTGLQATANGGLLGAGGLLGSVGGFLQPLLGTVGQLTSNLPLLGLLLGSQQGNWQCGTSQCPTQTGTSPLTGLLSLNNGLLASILGLLNPAIGTVQQLTGSLPLVGPLIGNLQLSSLTGATAVTQVPTTGGLVNNVVVPLLNNVNQIVSGLPILGSTLSGVLTPVSRLLVDVVNTVILLLQGLPVVGGILTSVVVVPAPGTTLVQGCSLNPGAVSLKLNLNLPIPAVSVQAGAPNIDVFVGLFTESAAPQQVVCSKIKVQV